LELDPYVIDTLLPDLVGHDRKPAALLVYLVLWRRSDDSPDGWTRIALRELAEGTGLSKRSVQAAIQRLARRKLVSVRRASITSVGEYRVERPWRREDTS
jgi:DNA-binding MarR family transcriptional regulator